MNFLRNLSVRAKLILLSIIPLAGLLYYLQINIRQDLDNRENAKQVLRDVVVVEEASKVIHEFQKERAMTLSLLSGGEVDKGRELIGQREATDKAIFSLGKVLDEQGRSIARYGLIDSVPSIRSRVNAGGAVSEIDPFYRDIKSTLLDGVGEVLRSSQNLLLKNHFEEHLFLLYSKEFLAQVRSELATALAEGGFSDSSYGEFASSKGKHDINLAKFQKIVSPELKAFFESRYHGPVVRETYDIIEWAFRNPQASGFRERYDAWWNAASTSINSLKEIEDYSSYLINQMAEAQLSAAEGRVVQNLSIACFIMALILLIVVYTVRGIVKAIANIKVAADRMAKGDVNVVLDINSRDEIGALAIAFNEMVAVTRKFSVVADTIGKGDYSPVVEVRGASDTLGIALQQMKENLKKLSEENEVRTWLLTGNGKLNDAMRGEKDVRVLAQEVIIQIANHLNAQIGAIYLAEGNHLELAGSYAYQYRKENMNRFRIGHGLVGQAALEKKPIVFDRVPEDYVRIRSGLGSAVPRTIAVYPFLFDGEVKGVIEVGSAEAFTDLHMQFLEMVGENVAIAVNAAQSREKLKELLEETQRQAEELETQQEELRQSNEELQEKTRLLEESEGELKAQQEQLQNTNQELEEKANLLEEQKEKLGLAKLEIEKKANDLELTSKYKSEFLANMSHELRTPLNSILILSQLLSDNKNGVLGKKEVEFCRNIHNSGADLLNLINEILDLSKVESGRMELDVEEVSLPDVKASMESMFTEVAKSKMIDFQVQLDERAMATPIVTDRQRVEQILKNLLSNAFKFTADNGAVTLRIEMAPMNTRYVNPRLFDVSDIVAFSVTDNGIGIREEKLSVIFEAFQQADGSTKRKYGGTGLGLSISREFANVLGGEIQVESREGRGSTFTLYLPLKFEEAALPFAERKVEVKPGSRPVPVTPERTREHVTVGRSSEDEGIVSDDRHQIYEKDKVILIIEDDSQFASVVADFVRSRNYKVVVAGSGNTGLSYARQFKPDAILLDMKLPVMDGSEVLRHLKNDPDLRHIPVQIISAHNQRRESLELGAFDFIQKPISQEQLKGAFDKIEEFMKKKLKKLLVIEDDKKQNAAIRELIGEGDVKSYAAYSGVEAYEMMSKVKYDCVILDLGLPDMTGFELLDRIKRNDDLNKVPVIVYTGRDLSREEHTRLMKFANTVVLKSVDSHERLLDETMLFLHRVESRLPREKQNIIRKLHKTDEVLHNRKVLVVDDDIRNIYSLTNLLEEEGIECVTAENGKIALDVLKKNPGIELVLMDVMMPEMDGYEATKAIRSMSKFSKLPVIALTAKAMKGDREKCLTAGMSDYIAKPLNTEQLLSLMRIWLYR